MSNPSSIFDEMRNTVAFETTADFDVSWMTLADPYGFWHFSCVPSVLLSCKALTSLRRPFFGHIIGSRPNLFKRQKARHHDAIERGAQTVPSILLRASRYAFGVLLREL